MNLTSPTLSMLSQSTLTPAELEWINTAELYVISRRNKHRAGTRFKRRGIDEQGRLSIRYIDEQGRLSIRNYTESRAAPSPKGSAAPVVVMVVRVMLCTLRNIHLELSR